MVSVRKAVLADSEGLAKVHVDSWRQTYRGYMPDSVLDELSYGQSTQRWQNNLQHPKAETYVAVEEERDIVGFASLGTTRDEDMDQRWGELYALYVAPTKLRQGIGKLLMDCIVRNAKERFVCLHLWVGDRNDPAIAFYEAQGFSLDGQTKHEPAANGTPLGHLRMVRFEI